MQIRTALKTVIGQFVPSAELNLALSELKTASLGNEIEHFQALWTVALSDVYLHKASLLGPGSGERRGPAKIPNPPRHLSIFPIHTGDKRAYVIRFLNLFEPRAKKAPPRRKSGNGVFDRRAKNALEAGQSREIG